MPDPQIQALYYQFKSLNDLDTFDSAEPLSGSMGDFDFTLETGMLVARPRLHHSDREGARDALEPYLRSWERGAFLSAANHRIRFEYDHADIVDRDPDPGSATVYPETLHAGGHGAAFAPTIKRDNGRYPEPDAGFVTTTFTDGLAVRLRRVRDGAAEVPATANYVYSELVLKYGGTAKGRPRIRVAAAALSVAFDVLDKLGGLAAQYDPDIGRKAGKTPIPFTAAELWWLQAAMAALIRRTGELAAGTSVPLMLMSDLPSL